MLEKSRSKVHENDFIIVKTISRSQTQNQEDESKVFPAKIFSSGRDTINVQVLDKNLTLI